MDPLSMLPPAIARQSISRDELVVPQDAAIAAIDWCERNQILILGWQGWIQDAEGRVGHGNAPQGTVSLHHLSIEDAAELCRRTIRIDALEWAEKHPETTDRLYFCITLSTNGAAGESRVSAIK